jgi:hypothetical protein
LPPDGAGPPATSKRPRSAATLGHSARREQEEHTHIYHAQGEYLIKIKGLLQQERLAMDKHCILSLYFDI